MSKRVKANKLNTITYLKESIGEVTTRTIVPTSDSTIRAIDVTDLSAEDRQAFLDDWTEYQEYLEALRQTTFSYEEWYEHTRGRETSVKWRRFFVDSLEVVED